MAKVRPAYKSQPGPRVVKSGSVSKPGKLAKWAPKPQTGDSLRRVKAPL